VAELSPLPIDEVLPRVVDELRERGQVVLRAPTGAGKTTRVPPAVLDAGLAGKGQIVMLEPRRLAARTAARRIAFERGGSVGGEVGYRVRFDEKVGRDTRILIVTEGVLLRRLQEDPFLEGVGAVLFDEFHERNLYSDLALGMVRRVRQTVRPDLKLVVMSATLDPAPIAAYLGDAAVVESLGRTFPVTIKYDKPHDRRSIPELAAWGVQQVVSKTEGDVLVFLPGVGEIHRAARELEDFARRQDLALLTLYGDMPAEEQDRVLGPSPQRKVILSTNVAETSVTIEGVTVVVDTGVAKVLRFDPQVGLDRLELEPISKSSADQRAGRAGRTQPGTCLRLWDEVSQRHRREQDEPEIRRVDLAGPVLQLKCWGEQHVLEFPWFEPPRPETVQQAELLLRRLGALDAQGQVTADGRRLVPLPVHPRLARLLLEGHRLGESRRAAWLAAMLSERDPFFRPRQEATRGAPIRTVVKHHSRSDVLDRLAALEETDRGGPGEFPWGTVNRGAARFIAQAREQYLALMKQVFADVPSERRYDSEEALLRTLIAAFPDRVARRRDAGGEKGLMVGGRGVKLAPQSSVREGALFLCVDVDAGQTDALVRQASAVELEWLPGSSLATRVEVFFHPSQKQVVARRRTYFEDLVLSESPTSLPETDEPAEVLFGEAKKAWGQVFPTEDSAVAEYLARVQSLAQWMPDLQLPAPGAAERERALRNLCGRCRSFAELKQADWVGELRGLLTWSQQQAVEREAPEKLEVPSGSHIRLTYEAGRPPVLAVRIQEIFGWRETPRVAGGRVKVLLHLLAPNYRPQQVTDDLASFWANTYPQVRKELARRYPRHPWPDDPLTAKAIRK
jgi:ATP-dependent helicase HrpB